MTNIKQALTRKLGPLPAYAWLGILAVGLYIYRRGGLGALRAGTAPATDTTSVGSSADNAASRDPITLGPGESVYDPNTGQLIGTAPDQSGQSSDASSSDTGGTAPGDTSTEGSPVPVVTGGTHKQPRAGFHKGHSAGHQYFAPGIGWISKAKYAASKRKNKRTITKGAAVKQPTSGKSRTRGAAKLLTPTRKKVAAESPKGRTRGKVNNGGSPVAPRTRAHKVGTNPVMVQHTAGTPKVVHPVTQKVTPVKRTVAAAPAPKRTSKKKR